MWTLPKGNKVKWYNIINFDELEKEEIHRFHINDKPYCLIRLVDEILCFMDMCPHQKAEMSYGKLQSLVTTNGDNELVVSECKEVITCPWHGWEFKVRTGESVFCSKKKYKLIHLPTKVEKNNIFVKAN